MLPKLVGCGPPAQGLTVAVSLRGKERLHNKNKKCPFFSLLFGVLGSSLQGSPDPPGQHCWLQVNGKKPSQPQPQHFGGGGVMLLPSPLPRESIGIAKPPPRRLSVAIDKLPQVPGGLRPILGRGCFKMLPFPLATALQGNGCAGGGGGGEVEGKE